MPENDKKKRFMQTYANLPIGVRNEIICVFPDKGPITWNAAYLEIANDSLLASDILSKLDELKFI